MGVGGRLRDEDATVADLVSRLYKVMRADVAHNLRPRVDLSIENIFDLVDRTLVQVLVHVGGAYTKLWVVRMQ